MTAEWYAELAEKQLQELLDMEAKMGSEMRSMKKRGVDLMDEDDDAPMEDEEAVEPEDEELEDDEEDEDVVEPTEEELAAPRRPMREKGMNKPEMMDRPMPKGPMMKKKPMDDSSISPMKPLSRDELMEKLFGKPKSGGNSPKAPNPSQGKGKK
jgi:hypothetical protein